MEHSTIIASLKWIFSAGYAKSEIYSATVTARFFSHGAVIVSYNYNVGPPDN